uniref:Uncharacterized protein n=1 Tax=Chromera velia CCMP2878 TaxID=1169474 RepID=A0A0G4HTH3_9ALVE|eukprot:Cvel_8476.t1-p1 / transcript=Cvel_8476.t1 / gene=Cvel_8476 / organism=Chromera_velia_CCMP2878 / gene_product=hypothetical protein / transcript_product=hypothetical protein / location=Cvel_scaffold468:45234-47401(+) / protein_length=232 / sequence_SO=supercontig / SO=protein_coding / is_pseudo=false
MANVQGIGEAAGAQAPAFPEKFVDPSSQEAQAAAGKLTAAYPNDPVSAPYFVSAPSQPQVISGVPPGTTYYPPSTAYDAYRGYVDRVTPGGVHEMPYRNPARYMGGDPREGRMGMPQVLSRAALSSPFQTKAGGAFREAEMARGAREKGGLNADEGFVELDRSGRPLLPQRRPSFSANRTFRLRAETVKKPAVAAKRRTAGVFDGHEEGVVTAEDESRSETGEGGEPRLDRV